MAPLLHSPPIPPSLHVSSPTQPAYAARSCRYSGLPPKMTWFLFLTIFFSLCMYRANLRFASDEQESRQGCHRADSVHGTLRKVWLRRVLGWSCYSPMLAIWIGPAKHSLIFGFLGCVFLCCLIIWMWQLCSPLLRLRVHAFLLSALGSMQEIHMRA